MRLTLLVSGREKDAPALVVSGRQKCTAVCWSVGEKYAQNHWLVGENLNALLLVVSGREMPGIIGQLEKNCQS